MGIQPFWIVRQAYSLIDLLKNGKIYQLAG